MTQDKHGIGTARIDFADSQIFAGNMLRSGVSPVSKVLLRQQNVSTQGTLRLKSTLPGLPVFAPKKVDNGAGSQFLRQWYRV